MEILFPAPANISKSISFKMKYEDLIVTTLGKGSVVSPLKDFPAGGQSCL